MQHCLLLVGVGIDSITVVHYQCHAIDVNRKTLFYNIKPFADFTGIDRIKAASGESMLLLSLSKYPNAKLKLWRGTYRSPKPPRKLRGKRLGFAFLASEKI
jgi:hypothetical protein